MASSKYVSCAVEGSQIDEAYSSLDLTSVLCNVSLREEGVREKLRRKKPSVQLAELVTYSMRVCHDRLLVM